MNQAAESAQKLGYIWLQPGVTRRNGRALLYCALTGIPVLFVLWPGEGGAAPGARFEALLEGIQETEARIFLEKAIDAGRLSRPLAQKARKLLARHFQETNICQGNSIIHSIEEHHHYGWQDRSRRLYEMAAAAK